MTVDLTGALRAHASGLFRDEASVELLISHGCWLHRSSFTSEFVQVGRGLVDGRAMAVVDWPTVIAALQAGRLACSGGEQRILRIAASLGEGIRVDLRDALTGLDELNLGLVAAAVLHAGGLRPGMQREQS
jgi:hypothetical protein